MFPHLDKKDLLIIVLALLLPVGVTAQPRNPQVAQIDSYVTEIQRYTKQNPRMRLLFADVSPYDSEKPEWKKFKTKAALEKLEVYDSAVAWTRKGKVVAVDLALSSPSGDWADFVRYYFREDGSLAKVEGRLNTFFGDVSLIRNQYFNQRGELVRKTTKVLDLYTQKPKKTTEYMDQEVPVYRKVEELPFFKLL